METVTETSWTTQIGDFACTAILDSAMVIPPEMVLPPALRDEWPPLTVDDDGRIEIPVICLLVRGNGVCILVDGGNGVRTGRPELMNGKLPERLAALGVDRSDIDYAVATHVHTDHVHGWIELDENGKGSPVFTGARHLVPRPDWAFTQVPPSDLGQDSPLVLGAPSRQQVLNTLAAAGLLDVVATDAVIVPGVRFVHAPGHSPGHCAVLIESGDDCLVFAGDVYHLPEQIEQVDLVSVVTDYPRELVPETRRNIRQLAEERGALLVCTHFAFPGAGHVTSRPDATFAFTPVG